MEKKELGHVFRFLYILFPTMFFIPLIVTGLGVHGNNFTVAAAYCFYTAVYYSMAAILNFLIEKRKVGKLYNAVPFVYALLLWGVLNLAYNVLNSRFNFYDEHAISPILLLLTVFVAMLCGAVYRIIDLDKVFVRNHLIAWIILYAVLYFFTGMIFAAPYSIVLFVILWLFSGSMYRMDKTFVINQAVSESTGKIVKRHNIQIFVILAAVVGIGAVFFTFVPLILAYLGNKLYELIRQLLIYLLSGEAENRIVEHVGGEAGVQELTLREGGEWTMYILFLIFAIVIIFALRKKIYQLIRKINRYLNTFFYGEYKSPEETSRVNPYREAVFSVEKDDVSIPRSFAEYTKNLKKLKGEKERYRYEYTVLYYLMNIKYKELNKSDTPNEVDVKYSDNITENKISNLSALNKITLTFNKSRYGGDFTGQYDFPETEVNDSVKELYSSVSFS